jgi:hypothetical protein
MQVIEQTTVELLRVGAYRLTGHQRRLFQAEVSLKLFAGNTRQTERILGWGRENVAKGIHEFQTGIRCLEIRRSRNHLRAEERNPRLAADIRDIVGPQSYTDPELKSTRRYTNLSAREVRETLLERGYRDADLPSERSMRDVLNRMNFRLKRIKKGKPLKKTKDTDAIFANVKAVRQEVRDDPQTLEISMDTKAKVSIGDYVQGGKMSVG